MGYLSSYFGGSKPTKYLVACRVAALIGAVLDDVGIDGLVSGEIVLKTDFTVAFCSGDVFKQLLASVNPRVQLARFLADREAHRNDNEYLYQHVFVDSMTYAVIVEFEKQTTAFGTLDAMFKPCGKYYVNGRSNQFLDAAKRKDKSDLLRLLGSGDAKHYLMETYESAGEAEVRKRKLASEFADGTFEAY